MRRLLLIFAVVLFPAVAPAQTKIKVGTVRSTVIGGVVSAQARGYFKDAGLDVDVALIDASAAFMPALATNELNVVEGGISASLFNGVAQGLPIKIVFDSTSTPINHSLMLRNDLKNEIKSIRDLKGRTVAVNAPNSIALYEVTRILESADLTINDVQTKVIPFAHMAVAFHQGHRRGPRDHAVHRAAAQTGARDRLGRFRYRR
jgi:NitT/TauT family transport system substrate-binding protein